MIEENEEKRDVARLGRVVYAVVAMALILIAGATVGIILVNVGSANQSTQGRGGYPTTSSPSPTSPPLPTAPWGTAASGNYRFASVVTDTSLCSVVGTAIMAEKGGSAVDAMIATALCEGAVDFYSSGIGGGFFMTVYDRPRNQTTREITTLIARERAPLAATQDMYVGKPGASLTGGLAIAVPGTVKGFHEAWLRYGRVPWSDLVAPTIALCQYGFPLEAGMAKIVASLESTVRSFPALSAILVKSDGSLKKAGDTIVLPTLANTLRRIQADPDDFYVGSLAQDIAQDIQDAGGIITPADLAAYTAEFKQPVTSQLNNGGYTMYGPPPPSSGVVLQFIMGILDGYNFNPSNIATLPNKILTYHRIIEAFKFAFAKRSRLADANFVDVRELVANMTSKEYTDSIRSMISDLHTNDVNYYGPTFDTISASNQTSNMVVRAPDGGVAVMTNTINTEWGSKVIGTRTGINFNNEMDDFSTPGLVNAYGVVPSPSNYIEPGKIPQSSMCPSIFVDSCGNVVLAIGAAGGTRILTSTSFVSIHSLWLGQRINDAANMPRLHHQLLPNTVYFEPNSDPAVLAGLAKLGHSTTIFGNIGLCGAVRDTCSCGAPVSTNRNSCLETESDGRKGGVPDGF